MNMLHQAGFITRDMPANLDAEIGLIGVVMLRNSVFSRVAEVVKAEHFYEPAHQQIWATIEKLISGGSIANPITLKTYLGDGQFGNGTVIEYLSRCAADAAPPASALDYAKQIRDMAGRRDIIVLADSMMSKAYEAPVGVTSPVLFAELESTFDAARPPITEESTGFADLDSFETDDIYEAYKRGSGIAGLSTGFSNLDDKLGGLRKSDLIILGGRPASGKTALATNIGMAVARYVKAQRKEGVNLGSVAFFSLEMSRKQLKARIQADIAGVPFWVLGRGIADEKQMQRYVDAGYELAGVPLRIDHTGGLTINQLRIRARGEKRKNGLALVIVDYLQLLAGSDRSRGNRTSEVTEISVGLKQLAKELEVPIIALSQLSRDVEKRDDKRPQLSDLRESGSIEQDADVVMFMYREEYYLQKNEPRPDTEKYDEWLRLKRQWKGVAEAIISKNRHGPEGTAVLGFEAEFTRFLNQPQARQVEPAAYRERAEAAASFSGDVKELYELLSAMSLTHSTIATPELMAESPQICPRARLIRLEDARKAFGEKVLAGASESRIASAFSAAFKTIRTAGVGAFAGKAETQFWVFLPGLVD